MKKTVSILLVCLLAMLCVTACGKKTTSSAGASNASGSANALSEYEQGLMESEYASGKHHVEIVVKDLGTIALELDADTAPITTANFCTLASEGFYDGLTFHRIMDGFMVQGGDPTGTGFNGSGHEIKGEFEANGVANDISHVRGTISMARATPPDSASSQFFIVHQDSDFLDGNYAGFGTVTSGMEVVDALAQDTPVEDNNGTVARDNQPVIESISVID